MKLKEMTAKAENLEPVIRQYAAAAKQNKEKFSHVGDIEDRCQVLKLDGEYLLYNANEFIGYFYLDKPSSRFRLRLALVDEKYRRQNYFSLFIWFLVRHEGVEQLEISDVHSIDTIEALKKLSYRMDLYWEKDGKREKYDAASTQKYYGLKQTGWVVVVENEGASKMFENCPRFFSLEDRNIWSFYNWLLEKVD